tara:strand:- start:38420 stop:39433 length:1014 start_codon:yes stop_codon:yes gene_type:complete
MKNFRNTFISSVNLGASIIPTSLLKRVCRQSMILPFYHTISDLDVPHIKNLYQPKGTKDFIKDLDFLLKHFKPIDYQEFKVLSETNKKNKKPSFLLSFDDGLSEFHDVIAPILLQKEIPAICFLNSNFIDNKDLFYRYKASLLINELQKDSKLDLKAKTLFSNTKSTTENILSIDYQNKDLLDKLAQLINYDFKGFLLNEKPYLTSKQIKALVTKGFSFGGHSIDHPEYQYLEMQEQLKQTKESIESICTNFCLDYKIFSFPFTDYKVSKEFYNQLKQNNIAETTFGSAGQKKDSIANNFQRIPFEMTNMSAKQILNSELLYYLLKMPLGKNVIKRK